MNLKLEWMSQLRVAAGQALQTVECDEGARLKRALELALDQLPADRARALKVLLFDGESLTQGVLVALDGVQVPHGTDPELSDGATLLLGSPIAGG